MLRSRWLAAALATMLFAGGVASAGWLGDIIKAGGTKLVIETYGDEINDFMNKLSKNDTLGPGYATKVVYVVALGKGTRVGAVQVIGPPEQVARVRSVVQIEGRIRLLDLRVRGLVPIDNTRGSFEGPERVEGVGVCGQIDIDL